MDKRDPPTHVVSTMVDDCFFILSQCSRRALSTCNVDCFCAMVNHFGSLLSVEFASVLRNRIQPRSGLDFSAFQGKMQGKMSVYEEVMISMNNSEVGKREIA